MSRLFKNIKKYTLRGFISLLPLALVYFVIRFLYLSIDQHLMHFVSQYTGINLPGLGILLIFIFLYLTGHLSSRLLGKWILNGFENIARKIPIIGTTYVVGKQISNSLLLPEKQVFNKVVLVDYLKEGIYTIGFITGSIKEIKTGRKLLKVFIPTPPNPTTGTMVIVDEKEVIDPGWTVDEGFRTVISGGIIGPTDIEMKKMIG